jgi:hypothetical protein
LSREIKRPNRKFLLCFLECFAINEKYEKERGALVAYMKIVNEQVIRDIKNGVPIKIDLGTGGAGRNGFYSLDKLPLNGVDIVADLNEPLDQLADNSVGEVYSHHTLEHIDNFLGLMSEIHRITRRDGRIQIIVPHFSNPYGYSDPTHVRFFGLYTMYYFAPPQEQPKRKVPAYYSQTRFHVESIQIQFYRNGLLDRLFASGFSRMINRSFGWQEFYERRLSAFFHARQIEFILRPIKDPVKAPECLFESYP